MDRKYKLEDLTPNEELQIMLAYEEADSFGDMDFLDDALILDSENDNID